MKTIKILFLLSTIVSTIGCSDLEENPVGILAPESFFSSLDDLQVAVNGTYGRVGHEDIWGRKFTLTIMVRGDMEILEIRPLHREELTTMILQYCQIME